MALGGPGNEQPRDENSKILNLEIFSNKLNNHPRSPPKFPPSPPRTPVVLISKPLVSKPPVLKHKADIGASSAIYAEAPPLLLPGAVGTAG